MKSQKSMAMLGIDNQTAQNDLPDEFKQGIFYPDELKNGDIDTMTISDLYNIHLGNNNNGNMDVDDNKINKMNNNISSSFYQLVFDIKHCIFKAGNDTKLLFSIFDDTDKKFITEEYCLHLSENNFPSVGSPEDCKVLFKNLSYDVLKHSLYITCRIYRIGPMEAPDVLKKGSSSSKTSKTSKNSIIRPYAATVIHLKNHINKLLSSLGEEITFEAGDAPICCPNDEKLFVGLTFDLIGNKKGSYYLAPLSIGIAHGLILYNGGINIVENNYKYFDKLTEIDTLYINPTYHNDKHILYVTIHNTHVNQRNKRSACNVCVRMQLRNNKQPYNIIPGSIMLGRGKMAIPSNEAISPVYYHNNDPIINQTYHILIPSSIIKLENTHLYFTCWHTPATNKKPDERGFAYIKLFHNKFQQLIANNEYELPLYRADKKTINNYLDNQQLKSENKTIRIFFRLSSTRIYSDIDVHKFLSYNPSIAVANDLSMALSIKRVAKQPFDKLLIILDELMKTIFRIMLSSSDNLLIEQTFSTLICVLGEVNKGVNIKYKYRIEEWIENYFNFRQIWRTLAIQQSRLLQWIASSEAVRAQSKSAPTELKQRGAEMIRQLQHSMRGVKYLFNIMKRSCELEIEDAKNKNDNNTITKITNEYNRQITSLFLSMNRVMGLREPKSVAGVQSFALRNFLSLLDSVPTQTSYELTQTVVKFIDSVQNQGVNNSVEKLLLIRRCLEHPKLNRKDIINILLPSICSPLHYHMKQSIDERCTCATIIQKCIPFLSSTISGQIPSESLLDSFTMLMFSMFGVLDDIRNLDLSIDIQSIQKIFGKNIQKNQKIISKNNINQIGTTIINISSDQLSVHRDFFVTISNLTRILMIHNGNNSSSIDFNDITTWGNKCDRVDRAISRLRKESELTAVLVIESVLKCCNNILLNSVFESSWIIMRMIESEVSMRCLSWFGNTLKRNYLSASFLSGKSLWKQWLSLGIIFLSSDDFALEDMISSSKKDIILNNYGDIRNIIIKKLSIAWEVLTPHRSQLADTMIKAAVNISSSSVTEISEFSVNIYYAMIKSEYESSLNITSVETHTIDEIDQLTAKYSHKSKLINRYLDFFRIRVKSKLNQSNSALKKIGFTFLDDIERLYSYLVQLKKLPNDAEHEDERTFATLSLLNYLNNTGKNELYNRYIHHLALMHQSLSNHIEAAICFKSHADRLLWSDNILKKEPLVGLPKELEWKRHVNLLELSHKHFMLGEAWESGVNVCKELANSYENNIFDLKSLSSILEKQSVIWKMINNQDRVFHSCYLVQFCGNNKSGKFIYKSGNGKQTETVRDFTDRIKKKYINAHVINSSDPIPIKYTNDDYKGEYIQITTLTPSSYDELNDANFKWDNYPYNKAPLRLKKYYRENQTNTFYYTYFVQKNKKNKKNADYNEFREIWITKVFIVAEDFIPSMRRRIPVISEKIVEYTPFQTAINSLVSKTDDISKILETLVNDPKKNTHSLSMNLNGVLDAAVMGGINKYREAFFDGKYLKQFPNEINIVKDFINALKQQMLYAKNGLDLYEKYAVNDLKPHVEHLKTCYKKQIIALTEFYKETQKYIK